MSRILKTTVYQYDELSPAAQSRTRDWWREARAGDDFFAECVSDDFVSVGDALGIDTRQQFVRLSDGTHTYRPALYWSGFWSQGDGASFRAEYRYVKGAAAAVREHAPQDAELHRIADKLQALQRQCFYQFRASIETRGHYSHSGTMYLSTWDCGTYAGEVLEDEFLQCFRDLADWFYQQLEAAWEWENADEQIIENIRANEYEFTEDGERA